MIRTPEQEAAQEAAGRLVRRCVAGDPQAWQQLVVSQHRRIYAICYRFTGSGTDAEDLTQDVFLKLYRNLASFDVERGSFQTWITTLARNLLVDHFRRTRLERATDSLDASFSGDDDGATLADRMAELTDPGRSPEAHASGMELKVRIQQALAGRCSGSRRRTATSPSTRARCCRCLRCRRLRPNLRWLQDRPRARRKLTRRRVRHACAVGALLGYYFSSLVCGEWVTDFGLEGDFAGFPAMSFGL